MKPLSMDSSPGVDRIQYIVFFFASAIYLNTIGHGYALDDGAVLTHARKGLSDVMSLLTGDLFSPVYGQPLDIGIRWRPLPLFISALEYNCFGEAPFAGHLLNIVLYGTTCTVLFRLLRTLFSPNLLLAMCASLLFAAHPVHTEVVANIKSRDELFSLLFLLLTLYHLLSANGTSIKRQLLFGCGFYFLALLSKENGITFIAIIPLFLYVFTDRSLAQSLSRSLPFIGIAAVYLLLRASVFHGFLVADVNRDILENQYYGLPFLQKFANISLVFEKYLSLLIFPHPLSCDYSYNQIPIIDWSEPLAYMSVVLHAGLLLYALFYIRKNQTDIFKRSLSFCILFYFISMSVVSNLAFNIGTPMAERFLFAPSLAFCTATALLLYRFAGRGNEGIHNIPAGIYLPFGLLLAACIFKTLDRNKDWENNLTLFSRDVMVAPNSAKLHYYYGGELLDSYAGAAHGSPGKVAALQKSITEQKTAIRIYPHFYVAHYSIGRVYEEVGMIDSAIYFYEKATGMEPRYADAWGKLGLMYGREKEDPEKAIACFEKALQLKPGNALWGLQLGAAYGMKGQYEKAIRIFQQVKKMDEEKTDECDLNIGTAYLLQEKYSEALKYFHQLLEKNPQNEAARQKAGQTYQAMGDTIKAGEYLSRTG